MMGRRAADRRSRRIRRIIAVGAVALVAVTAPAAGSAKPASAADTPTLTVAMPAADAAFASVVVADKLGYFKKLHVNVNILVAGLNTLTLLTSHQADLTMFGSGQALILPTNGLPTSIVYTTFGNGEAAYVLVRGDSPYHSLMDLSGKRVGVLSVGGSSYGYGHIFSSYVASHGGQPFNIVSTSSVATLVSEVESGQLDAAVAVASFFADAINGGQIRILVDPRKNDPVVKGDLGKGVAEGAIFGLTSDLNAKRAWVTRFVAAVDMAGRWLHKASPQKIASVIQTADGFNAVAPSALVAGATYNKPFYSPNFGFVTQGMWQSTLSNIANWQIPNVDVGSELSNYYNRIDMSYLLAARKLERKLGILPKTTTKKKAKK